MRCLLSLTTIFLFLLPVTVFASTTTYVYDELDRLQEVVLENGTHITYEYDEIGNIKSKKPSGSNVASITATTSTGGSVYPSGVCSITFGGSKTYTITLSPGYKVTNVSVDGVSKGAITSYSFTNITANHTIVATFVAL